MDERMGAEKGLRRFWRLEPLHPSFPQHLTAESGLGHGELLLRILAHDNVD
jgi:hypothetical protein